MENPAANTICDDRDKLVKFWIFGEKGVGKRTLVQTFVVSHHFLEGWVPFLLDIQAAKC